MKPPRKPNADSGTHMENRNPHGKSKAGRKKGRQPGRTYCTANGDTCGNFPMPGMKTCRFHGGTQPVGSDSPNFKHGRHSNHVPKTLETLKAEGLASASLLSQLEAIAETTARREELWDQLVNLSEITDWKTLQTMWRELWSINDQLAVATTEEAKQRLRLEFVAVKTRLDELVKAGGKKERAWEEYRKTAESARRLIESERKREIESAQVLSANQVATLLGMVAEAVRRHVSNPAELRSISTEFVRLTGTTLGPPAGTGSSAGTE